MAFFVSVKKERDKEAKSVRDEDITPWILSIAKKIGLSLVELNELTTQDFIDIISAYSDNKEDETRQATQEEIDKFFV